MKARAQSPSILVLTVTAIGLATILALGLASCSAREDSTLVVWTYDSFVSEWGAGPKLAPLFEKKTGIKVEFVSKGDGGQLLAAVLLEGRSARADLVLGLDDQLAPRALASGLFRSYKPSGLDDVPAELRFDPTNRLIPFDYGYFAFIWDSEKLATPPKSLAELGSPAFAKKLIIMDPRSSTPGLGLLSWSMAVMGEGWKDFWKGLTPSVLAMTPGWDTGYGLFTAGEAPLVLSYSTSPAYHREYEGSDRYRALEFPEGHPREIEAAGILASSTRVAAARKFMDFLISEEAQKELPLTQWMFPARSGIELPASYAAALRPARALPFQGSDSRTEDLAAAAAEAARALGGM